jgi:hypothetical protein
MSSTPPWPHGHPDYPIPEALADLLPGDDSVWYWCDDIVPGVAQRVRVAHCWWDNHTATTWVCFEKVSVAPDGSLDRFGRIQYATFGDWIESAVIERLWPDRPILGDHFKSSSLPADGPTSSVVGDPAVSQQEAPSGVSVQQVPPSPAEPDSPPDWRMYDAVLAKRRRTATKVKEEVDRSIANWPPIVDVTQFVDRGPTSWGTFGDYVQAHIRFENDRLEADCQEAFRRTPLEQRHRLRTIDRPLTAAGAVDTPRTVACDISDLVQAHRDATLARDWATIEAQRGPRLGETDEEYCDRRGDYPDDWTPVMGVVEDVGGGHVNVWVERDTMDYPPAGVRVELRPPASDTVSPPGVNLSRFKQRAAEITAMSEAEVASKVNARNGEFVKDVNVRMTVWLVLDLLEAALNPT